MGQVSINLKKAELSSASFYLIKGQNLQSKRQVLTSGQKCFLQVHLTPIPNCLSQLSIKQLFLGS